MSACGSAAGGTSPSPTANTVAGQKIKHVIVIMQENRSFDTYFGTHPGVDGIPMQNGVPLVCVPDPATTTCVTPYVDHADVNSGGPDFDFSQQAHAPVTLPVHPVTTLTAK